MKKQLLLITALVTLIACNNQVKNDKGQIVACNPDTVSMDILTSDLFSMITITPLDSTIQIGVNPGIYEVGFTLVITSLRRKYIELTTTVI